MSGFGFGSGSSGFGSNNNQQQQGTGFGGFGSNNSGTGFGNSTSNTGFGTGTNNAGGGLFGGGSTGFGSGGGTNTGFGATNNQITPFGAKPFGTNTTSSGGGLFGAQTSTAGPSTGFSGFGTSNNTNTATPFGATNTGGGLFGNNKPAFGSNTGNTSNNIFGASNTGAFGTGGNNTTTGGAFGSPASSALGGPTPQCEGTGNTAFSAVIEKDAGNATNHFQSITFMQPYQKFSFEELRGADYTQGRRYGNGSGQAGAFGTNTGFGSFGNNTGSGFGLNSNNNPFGNSTGTTSAPFGSAQPTTTGFGAGNTGGGLFGSKPANLFGNTATSSQPSGGIFATSGSTGFGAGNNSGFGSGTTGGGLFGNTANANKDNAAGGFGFGAANTSTSGAFGTNSNTGGFGQNSSFGGGGLFGNTAPTSSPFGPSQQQGQQGQQGAQANPFGSFGQNQQGQNQSTTTTGFGSAFGNNQPSKAGGIFGNAGTSTDGAGLFGNNQNNQQQTTSGIFANTNSNQSGGSLFGNKPAGGGIFGNTGSNTGTTGSNLFGSTPNNNQNQQAQGGGIFGNNQQSSTGNLFGAGTNTNAGSGLLGGSQQSGGSNLFGFNTNNQQPQQQQSSGFNSGASLLGGSQQNQQQIQQPQAFQTSILDANPYGNHQLFQSLTTPAQNVGPIATPLSSSLNRRKSAILPQWRVNPNSASRLVTPQKRGYGFTYSTYGTPNSVSSNMSTPGGFSNGLLSASFGRNAGRSLGKSFSTSNLRRSFDAEDSILSPGAFSASGARFSNSGSLKKLTIDRNIRTDLFGTMDSNPAPAAIERNDPSRQPGILKKKVSFDASTVGGNGEQNIFDRANGDMSGALNQPESERATPSAEEQGFLRRSNRNTGNVNGKRSNGVSTQPEMEQIKGNELAVVPEDDTSLTNTASTDQREEGVKPQLDQQPGDYYMRPSLAELNDLPKDRLKSFRGFVVGREGCGRVAFQTAVDLTTVDLENLLGKQVIIIPRSATVYPENASKPPVGKGLNVPSIITLENSWPRSKDRQNVLHEKIGPRVTRHIDRLRKVGGTEFINYDRDLGEWSFKVEHFTTYAIYDETDGDTESFLQSTFSASPETPTPKSRSRGSRSQSSDNSRAYGNQSVSLIDDSESDPSADLDDTFEFKKIKTLPGTFDRETPHDDETADHQQEHDQIDKQSNPDERSLNSPYSNGVHELVESNENEVMIEDGESVITEDQEMADSYPHLGFTTERGIQENTLLTTDPVRPKSILKASQRFDWNGYGTPTRAKLIFNGDWTEQLQRTVSPKKQNRQALRESQATALLTREEDQVNTLRTSTRKDQREPSFKTSIDLMNSLFGQQPGRRTAKENVREGKKNGFEWPYPKKSYEVDDSDMSSMDKAFHMTHKPSWGPRSTLIYVTPNHTALENKRHAVTDNGISLNQRRVLVSHRKDLVSARFTHIGNLIADTLGLQKNESEIKMVSGVPFAKMRANLQFREFYDRVNDQDSFSVHEKLVWELASVLFDDLSGDMPEGISNNEEYYRLRVRKDRLSKFWKSLVQSDADNHAHRAASHEEKALAYLSGYNVEDACGALLDGRDFRLATMLSMIGGDISMRKDIADQLNHWRESNILSEITEPIRALYELLAGNTSICDGNEAGPPEDRIKSFIISERFGLDWRRAFGLRLWYGILEEQDIGAAVHLYFNDMEQGYEPKVPIPWFSEQNINVPWTDDNTRKREDVLWGLLKVFTDYTNSTHLAALEEVLLPYNCSANPVNARLSFQLYHTLKARGIVDFNTGNDGNKYTSQDKADQLIWDYATQLEAQGEWVWASFVTLHLTNHERRKIAIQGLLARHAHSIGAFDSEHFRALVTDLRIPEAWIWEAKALLARAVENDHVAEVGFLLEAGNWAEAHITLCSTVAPQAIIEEDYETLSRLLSGFKKTESLPTWNLGGQVYADYIRLLQIQKKPIGEPIESSSQDQKSKVLKKLLAALPAMMKDKGEHLSFNEKVAIHEMSGVVGKAMLAGNQKGIGKAKILQLPMTDDMHLKCTIDLGEAYYRAIMAGGR